MTVDFNGVEIYYEKTGQGPSLLMLHGNGEDSTIFTPLAARLSKHYTVYAMDSRNHGQSGRSDDFSYDAMAQDVSSFVWNMGMDSPYVIGFSDGAIIALKAMLLHPGTFSRMALLGANLSPKDFRPEVYSELLEEYEKCGDPLLNLMLTQPDMRPSDLYGIDVPVFVIGAENDIFKTETLTAITDALPSARLKFMYGHDHGSYIVNNDMLYEPLHDFFRTF